MTDAQHTLLFASGNQGKLREAQEIFAQVGFAVISPSSITEVSNLDVPETGDTFAENAQLKARAYGQKSGMVTFADDSGIEVTALGGEPGVHSARWVEGTEHDRNLALLKRMEGQTDRRAKFVSVIALYDPKTDSTEFFRGEIAGELALEPRGSGGFGYDPLLIPEGHSQTFAQLGDVVKNSISHRYRAMMGLVEFLRRRLPLSK